MVFASHIFLFGFLPLTLAAAFVLPRRFRNVVLALAGLGFLGWLHPLAVPAVMAAVVVDFAAGLAMARPGAGRRAGLAAGIVANLLLLVGARWVAMHTDASQTGVRVLVPLAISIHALHAMGYLVDVYRGRAPALRRIGDLACFTCFFPSLLAGPVLRFADVSAALASRRETTAAFARGVALVSLGLAKVVLVAGPLGRAADAVFGSAGPCAADAWFGAVAFAFQILFEFGGYADIGVGIGCMLGFALPANFDAPYRAVSVTDFWRRWNVTLSGWLREYIGVAPDGTGRSGPRGAAVATAALLLIGLWHGVGWGVAAWVAIHAVILLAERGAGGSLVPQLPRPLQVAATFTVLLFAWVFFRAGHPGDAVRHIGAMLGFIPAEDGALLLDGLLYTPFNLVVVAAAGLAAWGGVPSHEWVRRLTPAKAALVLVLLAASVAMMSVHPPALSLSYVIP